eukprot:1152338-Pelagomonas_calceolata.AAC.2
MAAYSMGSTTKSANVLVQTHHRKATVHCMASRLQKRCLEPCIKAQQWHNVACCQAGAVAQSAQGSPRQRIEKRIQEVRSSKHPDETSASDCCHPATTSSRRSTLLGTAAVVASALVDVAARRPPEAFASIVDEVGLQLACCLRVGQDEPLTKLWATSKAVVCWAGVHNQGQCPLVVDNKRE